MMRILYLTNGFPYPLTSGRVRQYHFIRELSARHAVTLMSFVGKDFLPEHAEAMRPITDDVFTIFAPTKGEGRLKKVSSRVAMLFTGSTPLHAEMRRVVESAMREQLFDAVILSAATLPALEGLETPPLIVDVCDSAALHIRGRMKSAPASQRPLLWLGLKWAERFTEKVSARATHLLFASQRDLEAAVGEPFDRATVVANGVDVDFWKRSKQELGRKTILFTGGMKYPPNTDAALRLIREILPLVQKLVPDAKLLIVGHSPPKELVEAGERAEGVTVTGFVEDVRPYMEQASVFAAPLRFGAGIQNKLLEAMAMEVPVITSQLAADGLLPDGDARAPVEVVESSAVFAEAIIRRLAACEQDRTPDSSGRQFVEEYFTWDGNVEKLEQVLNKVARMPVEAQT